MGFYFYDIIYYGSYVDEETIKNINIDEESDIFVKKYVKRIDDSFLIGIKRKNTGYRKLSKEEMQIISSNLLTKIKENKNNMSLDDLSKRIIKHNNSDIITHMPDIVNFVNEDNQFIDGIRIFNDNDIRYILEDDEITEIKKEYEPILKYYSSPPRWIIAKCSWNTY